MTTAIDFLLESFRNLAWQPGREPVLYVTAAVVVLFYVLNGELSVEQLVVALAGLFTRGRVSPA